MLRSLIIVMALVASPALASAQSPGASGVAPAAPAVGASTTGDTKADAERALQAYLAMWSSNSGVTAAAVNRFYAPRVVYYGKVMSRAQVLADKRAYIRAWPVRLYQEVPGTFAATCNADRSLCHVTADMTWRRVNRRNITSSGRAHMAFDFVPADGARKIARESARLLREARG